MPEPFLKHRLGAIFAADAVGFSRLMADDERTTLALLDAARGVFRTHIEARRGRVIDMAGDSVLAVFETATGAVDAALMAQHELTATSPGPRMDFRIGVHLGDVIEKQDGTIYGDGVNVASRLQALAGPGGVVVSQAVHTVVGDRLGATFVDLGRHRLKNIERSTQAFEVVAGPDLAAGPQASATRTTTGDQRGDDDVQAKRRLPQRSAGPFVGRQPELADLAKALHNVCEGFGRVVLLAGPGGIGKSRLTQEVAIRAEQAGTIVLWGRCPEEAGAPAYWPWRQLIRGYLRQAGGADLTEIIGSALTDIASIVPEVAEQFDLAAGTQQTGDSAQSRFRLFDAIAQFWRRAARRTPLLLIFEDLHWADPTSLRLFAFLAAEIEDSAALMLGTYRDDELSRQHPLSETLSDLARSPVYQRIRLTGLGIRETEELLVAATGAAANANFVRALHARTEGHPLFLKETLRYLIDSRTTQLDQGIDSVGWSTRIPSGVREVIGRRVNRLSPEAAHLLSIAACIGRDFDLRLLMRLESGWSEDRVFQALEEALSEQLIVATSEAHAFRFGHALIRETLYGEMLGVRRERLHLRIGEILEEQHADSDPAVWPQLAYHFSEAGAGAPSVKALGHARRAAAHAARVLAFEEAGRWYRLALKLLQRQLPEDLAQRCDVLIALGDTEAWFGVPEDARAFYEEAAALARRCSLAARFAEAALGFSTTNTQASLSGEPSVALLLEAISMQHPGADAMHVRLISKLCVAYAYCDRADEALEAHRRAVALARGSGDRRELYAALSSIVSAGYWPDLLEQRLAAAREAWAIAEDLDLPDRIVEVLAFYLCDLVRSGHVELLASMVEQGVRLAEERCAFLCLSISRQIEVLIAIGEGRFADAERAATQALESGRRVGDDKAVGAYGMLMFCLRREQGRLREALPMLQRFVRDEPRANHWSPGLALLYAELDMREQCQVEFDALPWDRASQPPTDGATMTIVTFVAEVCVYLGDATRAALLYGLLHGHAGANLLADSSGPCLGSTDRLLGSLAATTKQWDVAERHFESALEMDKRTGWRVWLAHSRHRYAAMLRMRDATGDAERARRLLDDALLDSKSLRMDALTPRIEALLARRTAPIPTRPCGLTNREIDVLQLMAMGRNNREIGQVLVISPNTVANHVRNILEKTYTANRTEASAFARREGLLDE